MSNRLLSIGQPFPSFKKTAVVSLEKGKEFFDVTSLDMVNDDNR